MVFDITSNVLKFLCFFCLLKRTFTEITRYCDLKCKKDHILCRYYNTSCSVTDGCDAGTSMDVFTPDEQNEILRLHNEIRNDLAGLEDGTGSISNMNVLSYDLELEFVAQCETNTCEFTSGKLCVGTTKYNSVGSNVYRFNKEIEDEEKVIQIAIRSWYNQKALFDFSLASNFNNSLPKNVQKFSQLVWAETAEVGCGRVKNTMTIIIVCLYGPRGNVEGHPVFRTGAPCSRCPEKTCNEKYKNLCGNIQSTSPFNPPFSFHRSTEGGARISASVLGVSTTLMALKFLVC